MFFSEPSPRQKKWWNVTDLGFTLGHKVRNCLEGNRELKEGGAEQQNSSASCKAHKMNIAEWSRTQALEGGRPAFPSLFHSFLLGYPGPLIRLP